MDNRLSDKEVKSERKKDLDLDWKEVDRKDLGYKFGSILSFLDTDGFRYYLTVFLLASLEEEADFPFFHLTNFKNLSLRKSTPEMFVEKYKFDKKQCEAISNFLRFVCDFMQYGKAEQEAVQRWGNYVNQYV